MFLLLKNPFLADLVSAKTYTIAGTVLIGNHNVILKEKLLLCSLKVFLKKNEGGKQDLFQGIILQMSYESLKNKITKIYERTDCYTVEPPFSPCVFKKKKDICYD